MKQGRKAVKKSTKYQFPTLHAADAWAGDVNLRLLFAAVDAKLRLEKDRAARWCAPRIERASNGKVTQDRAA